MAAPFAGSGEKDDEFPLLDDVEGQEPRLFGTPFLEHGLDHLANRLSGHLCRFKRGHALLEPPRPLLQGLDLGLCLVDRGRDVPLRNRERRGGVPDGPVLILIVAEGPPAADELEAQIAPDLLPFDDLDEPDLPGPPTMGTAARGVVEAVHFDNADHPVLPFLRGFAERDGPDSLLGHEVGLDLQVFEDNGIRPRLDAVEVAVRDLRDPDLEGRDIIPDMEGQSGSLHDLIKSLG